MRAKLNIYAVNAFIALAIILSGYTLINGNDIMFVFLLGACFYLTGLRCWMENDHFQLSLALMKNRKVLNQGIAARRDLAPRGSVGLLYLISYVLFAVATAGELISYLGI